MNKEIKNYELLQDLPNVNKGAIIKLSGSGHSYTTTDKYGKMASFNRKLIENSPDWFKEILLVNPVLSIGDLADCKWLKAKDNSHLRFVTKKINDKIFLDDGWVSNQPPSEFCRYDNYIDCTKEEISKAWGQYGKRQTDIYESLLLEDKKAGEFNFNTDINNRGYKIIAYKGNKTGLIYTLSDNLWTCKGSNFASFPNTKKGVDESGCSIHSIIRLDGHIFSVGEINYGKTIEKFFDGWNGMEIHYTDGSATLLKEASVTPIDKKQADLQKILEQKFAEIKNLKIQRNEFEQRNIKLHRENILLTEKLKNK